MANTGVYGDVSSWAALTSATQMCVSQPMHSLTKAQTAMSAGVARHTNCGGWLVAVPQTLAKHGSVGRRKLVGIAHVGYTDVRPQIQALARWYSTLTVEMVGCRRYLQFTGVSGDVSSWASLPSATYMCVS